MVAYIKITADNVTDEQIEVLLREAANFGDENLVDLCDMALRQPYDDESRFQVRSARIRCACLVEDSRFDDRNMDES